MLKKKERDNRAVRLRNAQQSTRLRIVVGLPGKGRVRLGIREAEQKVRKFFINYQLSENQNRGTFLAIIRTESTLRPLRESRQRLVFFRLKV
jgi:hypothetical protein